MLVNVNKIMAMIESYLKQGGSPDSPIIDKFCRDQGITKEELIHAIQGGESTWNGLKIKIQKYASKR